VLLSHKDGYLLPSREQVVQQVLTDEPGGPGQKYVFSTHFLSSFPCGDLD
jgi:hypothetical protein